MLVLITYDVNTETAAAQYVTLKAELTALIEPETDSLRFYRLGNQYKQNVEHVGVQPAYALDSVLLI